MIKYTKQEIEKAIENVSRKIVIQRELSLESPDQASRDYAAKMFESYKIRLTELTTLLEGAV